jgi:hypothetical protein
MDRYWVHENWTHDYARVHKAECSHCNDGRGTQPSDSGQNTKWHGPFSKRDEAYEAARRLQATDARGCTVCGA